MAERRFDFVCPWGATMDSSLGEIDELLRRAAAGERGAIATLLVRNRRRLEKLIVARIDPRVRARVDPADVIQETFVSAAQQLPRYLATRPIPFYPWLRRIAWQTLARIHQRHLDAGCRSVRREQAWGWPGGDGSAIEFVRLLQADHSTPSGVLARNELRRDVHAALDQLSIADREILLQRYVEQKSIGEIAMSQQLTEAAIYKRHARALTRLRTLIHHVK